MSHRSALAGDAATTRDRGLALVAVLCAIGLVLLALTVGHGPLPVDLSVREALHVGGPVPPVLDILNIVGGGLVWDAGVAVLVGALFLAHHRLDAAWLAGGVLVGETLATVVKLIVDRPRPPGIAVTDLVTQASFPSGHVTRTAVTLALVVLLVPGGRPIRILAAAGALVVVVLMGLARIVVGEHWPTDVVGGYLLAGFVVACATVARSRVTPSAPDRRPPGMPDPAGAAAPP